MRFRLNVVEKVPAEGSPPSMVAIAPPPGDPKDLPAWLASFTNWEKQLPLGQERREWGPLRCRKLLDRLHLDTSQQRVIQVAGSKGKGSTVLWLESLLSIRGQTTAATTSPHLISLEERIRLNGEQVSFPRLLAGLHKIYPALIAGQSAGDPLPTFFDLWTALFTEIAVSEGVENILLEVGLGGPLDSTTAIPHDLGILTTIDLEHTALLGDTCEKIAAEKSKIARSGKPFMISSGETAGTAEQIARTLQSSPSISCEDSRIPDSVPSHQKLNGATALQALERLPEFEPFTSEEVSRAWKEMKLPARLEVLQGFPPLLLDGAHTPASLRAFVQGFRSFRNQQISPDSSSEHPRGGAILLGMLADKNPQATLAELSQLDPFPEICTLGIPVPRGMSAQEIAIELQPIADQHGRRLQVAESPEEGLRWLRKMAATGEPIAATGSMYLAGMVRKAWLAPEPS